MSMRYIRQYSRFVHLCSYFGLLSLWLLIITALLHYFEIISQGLFFLFIKIAVICALLSLLFAILTLRDMWRHGDKGGLKVLRAFIYSGFVLAFVGLVVVKFYKSPMVNDVSTELNDPPEFMIGCKDYQPTTLTLSREVPRRYDTSIDNIITAIAQLAGANHWTILQQQQHSQTALIELKCKNLFTGFISHIIIRVQKEKDTVFVDARSATCGLVRDGGLSDGVISFVLQQLDELLLIGESDTIDK